VAGLSSGKVVDVVAASEKLVPSQQPPTEPPSGLEVAPPAPTGVGTCPLGHENPAGTTFCGSCGLKVADQQVAAARVDLSQARPEQPQTDEDRAARDRQHLEAQRAAQAFENVPEEYVPSEEGGILIHFVADGLTAFGKVWYRGQELEIGPSHPRWAEAVRWITLTRYEQVDRYGEQKFEQGPWPGRRSYTEGLGAFERLAARRGSDGKLSGHFAGPSPEQLAQADEAERRRGRAVPAPSFR
jgi:hypothetical protein